ncbi:MAG: hypothetical protein K2P58_00500 [Hyphomonadaceae bacterium]|nr:hypothetical protein [Hyphomonadaceae bacterium]
MRAIIVAFALLLTPSVANATTAVDLVRSTCAARDADVEAISASLAAQNWRRLDDAERVQNPSWDLVSGFVMHWTTTQAWAPPGGDGLIVLGEGPFGQGEARARFCLVAEGVSFRRQVRDVRAWLGFDRFQTWGPGGDMFAYVRDDAGGFANGASLSEDARAAAANARRFGFVQVIGDRNGSAINYSVVNRVEPAS